jgi:hypothetical protein
LCIENQISITAIKVRRLEWAGRLVRTSDDRTVKEVFLEKPRERRRAGIQN